MRIELSFQEYISIFGHDFNIKTKIFNLNNVEMIAEYFIEDGSVYNGRTFTIGLIKVTQPKSKEELAAEESVRKAEEALKAAKDTLEKIKEK